MKVINNINLEILLEYGFEKIDRQEEEENDNFTISSHDYKFEIGHSRRGQFYYLLVNEDSRDIVIYASEPDGSGGAIGCPDVLMKLVGNGLVMESQ